MLPNNRHVRSLPVLLHSKEVTEVMIRVITNTETTLEGVNTVIPVSGHFHGMPALVE